MRKNTNSENYLERIPSQKEGLRWSLDNNGNVILNMENNGFFNRVAQKLFKKPKISYIHLDETGSFLWLLIDGKKDLRTLGELVDKQFGKKAHPIYERLLQYFRLLESYNFITY